MKKRAAWLSSLLWLLAVVGLDVLAPNPYADWDSPRSIAAWIVVVAVCAWRFIALPHRQRDHSAELAFPRGPAQFRRQLRTGDVPSDPEQRAALAGYIRHQRYEELPRDGRLLVLFAVVVSGTWWALSSTDSGLALVVLPLLVLAAFAARAIRLHEQRLLLIERRLANVPTQAVRSAQ